MAATSPAPGLTGTPSRVPATLPLPVDTPSDPPQVPAPASPLSTKRSWFTVLSWSTVKETTVVEVKAETVSLSEEQDAVHSCTDLSESRPQPSTLATIQSADSPAPVGNSSPRDAASRTPPSASRTPKINGVDALTVPSKQPVSQSLPSAQPLHSLVQVHAQDATTATAASNSATSKFAFNIPTLPKSKPPQAAVIPPPQDPSVGPSREVPIVTPGMDVLILQHSLGLITALWIDPRNTQNGVSVNVTEPTRVPSISTVHVSESESEHGNPSLGQTAPVSEVHTSTWWSYLGWNASQVDSSAERTIQSQSTDTHTSPADPDQLSISDPPGGSQPHSSSVLSAPTQPEGEVEARVDLTLDGNASEHSPSNDNKSLFVQNADTAGAPQGSTWYAPWSWYQASSTATTTTIAPDVPSGSQQDPLERSRTEPTTEEKHPGGSPYSTPGFSPSTGSIRHRIYKLRQSYSICDLRTSHRVDVILYLRKQFQ
ncbi:hypothetical protein JVU11DRAFT_8615 [Chiua virens]|nr:hypothetical protein JVU11DRAFT_8615 [Chiua virens]